MVESLSKLLAFLNPLRDCTPPYDCQERRTPSARSRMILIVNIRANSEQHLTKLAQKMKIGTRIFGTSIENNRMRVHKGARGVVNAHCPNELRRGALCGRLARNLDYESRK